MSFFVDRLRGMQDLFPPESLLFNEVEKIMEASASFYGFAPIRTPILEFTELFDRSVGDSSDIVQKEMYTFNDKANRSVTMRPEFTAGVLRAVVNNYSNSALFPLKFMYCGPCYRYEKPQVGRFREFYQFGLEVFGGDSFLADLEIISVAYDILTNLKLRNVTLEINCIGCSECKGKYLETVHSFFYDNYEVLCETCKSRLQLNPLRIFDCKNDACKELAIGAPSTVDFICDNCKEDFENLKKSLYVSGIPFTVNTRIVRGLDYYTKLVFEFVVNIDNFVFTICGGGRYDGLSNSLGGPSMPATGLAIGMERILKLLSDQKVYLCGKVGRDIFFCYLDDSSRLLAIDLVSQLRKLGIRADCDIVNRGLKSQLRYTDKMNYSFVSVLGPEEVKSNKINIKNMSNGKSESFSVEDIESFVNKLKMK